MWNQKHNSLWYVIKWCQHTEFCNEEWQNTFAAALFINKAASYGGGGHQMGFKMTSPHSSVLKIYQS